MSYTSTIVVKHSAFSKLLVLLLLLLGWSGHLWYPVTGALKYNVSLSQMETCHHYLIPETRGYVYLDFFHVPSLRNNRLANDELLHLKFYVMTSRDAHILLSVNNQPRLFDRVYEIGKHHPCLTHILF